MADPYATRAPDLSGRPAGPAPWRELVDHLGGAFVTDDGSLGANSEFVVVDCRGMGTLAPFARVEPALGSLLWLEHSSGERSAATANALLARLQGLGAPIYAIKQGCIGGPSDRPGCAPIELDLIASALRAARADGIRWEADPDFGYEVPAHVEGLDDEVARILLPRLRYADFDRVYEHATLVAAKKRARAAIAARLGGLEPAITAASGWPPSTGSGDWRE